MRHVALTVGRVAACGLSSSSRFCLARALVRTDVRFSVENARAHVDMLAGTIGSRPAGSANNAKARAYLIDQLRLYGFDVRVQETDAVRPEFGLTARVANIIAIKRGQQARRDRPRSRTTTRSPKRPARWTMGWASRCAWKRRACWRRRRDAPTA